MKNIFYIIALITVLAGFVLAQDAEKALALSKDSAGLTVQDYYYLLPDSNFAGCFCEMKKGKKAYLQNFTNRVSPKERLYNTYTVDNDTGFLQIEHVHEYTAGTSETFVFTMALYKINNGESIIGVSSIRNGAGGTWYDTAFFTYTGRVWTKLDMSQVLSFSQGIHAAFWSKTTYDDAMQMENNRRLIAQSQLDMVFSASGGPVTVSLMPPTYIRDIFSFSKYKKYNTVELDWNSKAGKFDLGKRY